MQKLATTSVVAALVVSGALWPDSPAYAYETNSQVTGGSPGEQVALVAAARSLALGATVFLAGLVAFAAMLRLPRWSVAVPGPDLAGSLVRLVWPLFCLLAISGSLEMSLYAVRASGEAFSPGLFWEAISSTRVGQAWSARILLAFLVALLATLAARRPRQPAYWLASAGCASAMLLTVTWVSHAAAEEGILPFLADWLHVMAASVWMGGLLGFPVLLLGPLRSMAPVNRKKLLRQTVRRFSKVAMIAVATLIATGLYAALLHVPNLNALFNTSYGLALVAKVALLGLLLTVAALNLLGRGLFGRIVGAELVLAFGIFVATGFLTTLPPADTAGYAPVTDGDGVARLELESASGPGVTGTAIFTEITGGVEVELEVSGLPEPGTVYLAHIHEGPCSSEGPAGTQEEHHSTSGGEVNYPLSPVSSGPGGAGSSVTTLWDLTFSEIFSSGGSVILHATGQGSTPPILACGDLNEAKRAE